mmetsp:Transcript_10060/g.25187  ORF Transcript_10060/g.25187 Transcript_10060/m.25187 type:complete len:327 (-) Transcript_10060:3-983(-)
MSCTLQPRLRSLLLGTLSPCRMGPTALQPPNRSASLYAMLPESKSGNTKQFTGFWSASALAGAFFCRMPGITAASSCNSPSTRKSEARSVPCASRCRMASASVTLSTRLCRAEPFELKLNRAMRGCCAKKVRQDSAVCCAIAASFSESGSGFTAQSANTKQRGSAWPEPSPPCATTLATGECAGASIKKKLLTTLVPSAKPTLRSAERITSPVAVAAPLTTPSTSPFFSNAFASSKSVRLRSTVKHPLASNSSAARSTRSSTWISGSANRSFGERFSSSTAPRTRASICATMPPLAVPGTAAVLRSLPCTRDAGDLRASCRSIFPS